MTTQYRVFSPGENTRLFDSYGDAQRFAWLILRSAGEGSIASVQLKGLDGSWRELEYWTLGPSGFRHHERHDPGSPSEGYLTRNPDSW